MIRVKLIEAIRESGLSQTQIAKKINIKQQAVSQYINGETMPALDTFANLCKILDLDANYILCLDDPENGSKTITVTESFNNNSGNINFKP